MILMTLRYLGLLRLQLLRNPAGDIIGVEHCLLTDALGAPHDGRAYVSEGELIYSILSNGLPNNPSDGHAYIFTLTENCDMDILYESEAFDSFAEGSARIVDISDERYFIINKGYVLGDESSYIIDKLADAGPERKATYHMPNGVASLTLSPMDGPNVTYPVMDTMGIDSLRVNAFMEPQPNAFYWETSWNDGIILTSTPTLWHPPVENDTLTAKVWVPNQTGFYYASNVLTLLPDDETAILEEPSLTTAKSQIYPQPDGGCFLA